MENKKPIKSKFTKSKHHSKSDAFALDLNRIEDNDINFSKSHKDTMNNLTEKNSKLTISLQKALQRNKELLAELKRKKGLEEKLEDQKNTTKELELLTSVCKPDPVVTTT